MVLILTWKRNYRKSEVRSLAMKNNRLIWGEWVAILYINMEVDPSSDPHRPVLMSGTYNDNIGMLVSCVRQYKENYWPNPCPEKQREHILREKWSRSSKPVNTMLDRTSRRSENKSRISTMSRRYYLHCADPAINRELGHWSTSLKSWGFTSQFVSEVHVLWWLADALINWDDSPASR